MAQSVNFVWSKGSRTQTAYPSLLLSLASSLSTIIMPVKPELRLHMFLFPLPYWLAQPAEGALREVRGQTGKTLIPPSNRMLPARSCCESPFPVETPPVSMSRPAAKRDELMSFLLPVHAQDSFANNHHSFELHSSGIDCGGTRCFTPSSFKCHFIVTSVFGLTDCI